MEFKKNKINYKSEIIKFNINNSKIFEIEIVQTQKK